MKRQTSIVFLMGIALAAAVLVFMAVVGTGGVQASSAPTTLTVGDITTDPEVPLLEPGESILISPVYTDPSGISTPYTVVLDWGDNSEPSRCEYGRSDDVGNTEASCMIAPTMNAVNEYRVTGSHVYTDPGVFPVVLTVMNGSGASDTSRFEYVVVYDPAGGFVTGGGWINSPEYAYKPSPTLTGKATFGFVSKYKKGAKTPTGNTQFQFQAGDLNFHSDSYDWLVVTGSDYARFKGVGTINGEGEYKFMLWAGDKNPDTFRIKIWEEDEAGNETITYDNGFEGSGYETGQSVSGGSIVIHTGKKK
jgi:hypothetical protein